ncbi:MAG: GNAT family N-acetyltransferase [Caldilineaceae bacterium]|nr:GNAT family N-acetyltransferase [Caldilineaceae bacterium]
MNVHPNLSAIDLMSVHRTTLFRQDTNNRLGAINEPGFPDPPRFWMGRTVQGNQWRFHHALPPETVATLEELCQAEPVPTDLRQPPQNAAAIKSALNRHAPIQSDYRGPAYWVPRAGDSPHQATLITSTNAELLHRHFADLLEPDTYHLLGPVAAVVVDGCAVSACFCSRIPGRATEAGVNTHPDYRGRGYATAAVAGWAAAVYEQGCLPLYSTSWENLASQAVARKLGMICYGEDWSLG